MVLGVQHVVGNTFLPEHTGQLLRLLNGDGTNQNRLSRLMALLNLPDNGPILAGIGLVDHIGMIDPDNRLIGGDFHDV